MKKKIFKILLWTTALLLLLILTFSAVLYLNKDKVQAAILSTLKESLEVPLEIGEAEISLKKFPKASLKFNSIFSPGLENKVSDTLLAAEEVFFLFDLWEIIKGNITIDQIHIENATINIVQLKNGHNNFTIWKQNKTDDNQLFTLSQISLFNVNFLFFDFNNNIEIKLDIKRNSLSGNFSESLFDIQSTGNFVVNKLQTRDFSLAKPRPIESNFSINYSAKDSLQFWGDASIFNSKIKFDGLNEKDNFSFSVSSKDLVLENIAQFLIDQKIQEKPEWEFSGKAYCHFNYASKPKAQSTYELEFSTKDSQLSNHDGFKIKGIELNGIYAKNQKTDFLRIDHFSGNTSDGDLDANILIEDFNRPFLKLHLNSTISLKEWLLLNPIDTIEKVDGKVKLDLDFENHFKSFNNISSKSLKNAISKGSINLEACEIKFKGHENSFRKLNGDLVFNNRQIDIERLFFQFKESDIYLMGRFANVINFMALENEKLIVDCKLTSQYILLDDFIKTETGGSTTYNLNFTDKILLDLDVDIQKFEMKKFSASKIKGELRVKNNLISINNLQLDSDEGGYTGNLSINTKSKDQYSIDAQLNFNEINIHNLFESFENFGQGAIVSKNIFGKAKGIASFKAKMNPNLEIDLSTILMESDIKITDGHIKDFEPMLELSKFSDIEDLKDVYFHSLENKISIKNSLITIPEMKVESNILNLQINGSHGFDNVVDYRIKLKASDALFNKRKKNTKPTEFDEHLQINERKDDHYIFIKMTGPMAKIKIELDNKSIGKSINQDLQNQKKELKELLKKDKEDKKTDDPGIIFEWDDDDDDG